MPEFASKLAQCLRSGDALCRRRIKAFCAVFLALEAAAFIAVVAGTHGLIVRLDRPTTTDFVSFYAAGTLAAEGAPERAYNHAAHYAAEEQATAPGIEYFHFYYPPIYLLLCAALAQLPYLAAFVLFVSLTLCAYLLAMGRILAREGAALYLPLLAFPAVWWTLGIGQNSFLTAAVFGGAGLLLERRPAAAGLLFGALCYKPQFGLLVPVALAAGQHWRALAAAAFCAAALALLSLILFGWGSWEAFFAALGASSAAYGSGAIDPAAFVNPFGAVLLLGGSARLAYFLQGLTIAAAAAVVARVWGGGARPGACLATLAAAALVAAPVALFYDLVLGTVAAAWLIRDGRERSFPEWEKSILAGLFFVPLLVRPFSDRSHLPLAALAGLALFVLAARNALTQKGAAAALDLTPLPHR